jgi:hypothetical protein
MWYFISNRHFDSYIIHQHFQESHRLTIYRKKGNSHLKKKLVCITIASGYSLNSGFQKYDYLLI